MSKIKKFKKGAASFYIVAVSTLILVIVAASFAAVIVSEVTRTSNDDLAQSAYDAALAGVEDAKLTFYNYQKCVNGEAGEGDDPVVSRYGNGQELRCSELEDWVRTGNTADSGEDPCDVVANSLGRTIEVEGEDQTKKGVLVQESSDDGNNMEQYYTCVKIQTKTEDYLGVLDSDDTEHSVRIKFDKTANPNAYNDVNKVRLSWHQFKVNEEGGGLSGDYFTWMSPNASGVFGTSKVTPAVVALTMVQTSDPFNLSDFDMSSADGRTDRGTVYLVPVDSAPSPTETDAYYSVAQNNGTNALIENDHGFWKSNNKDIKNKPVLVWCSKKTTQDYACTAELTIPQPIGGNRNEDTFIFSVSLPYGGPKTDYRLEFLHDTTVLPLDGVQVSIDSTGRANDLYRRVDTRLEPSDATYPYPIYGIEALDPGSNPGIEKNFDTLCEYDFEATCPR